MTTSNANGVDAERPTALAPFRHRLFLSMWIGSLVSNFGGLIQTVGASWLMTSIAPSPEMVALVQTSTNLPIVVFALIAGAAADVFDRRSVMLTAQFVMLGASILLCTLSWLGLVTPWLLLSITFLLGAANAAYGPAWQSSVGEQVPRGDLPAAVSLNSLGFNLARSAGPGLGGIVVATLGITAAFAINVLSYIGLLVVLLRWRRPVEETTLPRENILRAVLEGVRYTHRSPPVLAVLVRAFVFGVGCSAVMALMPLIARDQVAGGPSIYGLLLSAFGAGAVLSALLSTRLRSRLKIESIVLIATLFFASASLIGAFSSSLALTATGMVLGGIGWVLALPTFNIAVQQLVPRWVVGRSVAIYQSVAFGGMALGSWLWGIVAHDHGLAASLAGAGGLLLASLALSLVCPMPQIRPDDADLWRPTTEPTLSPAVPVATGEVCIIIEYRIVAKDRVAFAETMRHVGRLRQRAGAWRWSLLVDAADPEIWVEKFHCPTWADYLRQRSRGTVADREYYDRARTFHQGEGYPPIRRYLVQRIDLVAAGAPATPIGPVDI